MMRELSLIMFICIQWIRTTTTQQINLDELDLLDTVFLDYYIKYGEVNIINCSSSSSDYYVG